MESSPYPIPPHESERQDALYRYQILDTPPEESFDRLTRLAAQLFDVPVALVSLLDAGRQWHKSCYGFDAREIDRKVSFCAHNLVEDEVMVVEDAASDARFAENSLVTADPNIRFYAGAPLITPDRYTLGSLCVIDVEPRTFNATEQAQLRDLAAMVMDELELRREVAEHKRTERELRESESQFRALVEQTNDWVWEVDAEGQFTYVNPRATHILGYQSEELLGRTTFDFMRHDEAQRFADVLASYMDAQRPFDQLEKRVVHRDGHEVILETSGTPIFDDAGQLVGYRGVARDATERRQARVALQASEEKYRTVVENVKDVVFRTDAGGRLTFLNPAWTDVTGHNIEAALGRSMSTFVHDPDTESDWAEFKALLVGNKDFCRYEIQLKTVDDALRWMEVFARPVFDERGEVVGTSGTLHDVTKWREAEARMRKVLDKERELGRLKSRFVSMASHELRTPLATIQSSAELADLFMKRGANEKTNKHLRRIQSNVDRMATLLEDVLIFGRVESGRLPFEPVEMDVAGLAVELVNDIRQGIGAAHTLQTSGLDDEIAVEADPQLFRLVLTNLLSNAVKYSPEGSTVQLEVQHTDAEVRITVSDEGIGIPSDDLDRLFEPFHRAENVGAVNGTGLGLSILKEAIDLHRGDVKVDSTEGEGSTFYVILPRASPPTEATGVRTASTMNDA